MPKGLRDLISESAQHNHRSMNAEVVSRLLNSLEEEDGGIPGVREPRAAYTEMETTLITLYRRLPEDKRKALLALIA